MKDNGYYHLQAWILFGKTYCEVCGIHSLTSVLNGYGRHSMHNGLNPKDYSVMEQDAWICVCHMCHAKIEVMHKNEWTLYQIRDNRFYTTYENVYGYRAL